MVSFFGFVIHKNFAVNFMIYMGLNIIFTSAVLGFMNMFTNVVYSNVSGYILFLLLFSLIDYILFLLVYRFLAKAVFYSAGFLLVGVQVLSIYLASLAIPTFDFQAPIFINMLILSIILFGVRWVMSIYLRSKLYKGGNS